MSTNTQPQGLLAFLYNDYYDVDGTHQKFMSDSKGTMDSFGLTEAQIADIDSLGKTAESDDDLIDIFCKMLNDDLKSKAKAGGFKDKIW